MFTLYGLLSKALKDHSTLSVGTTVYLDQFVCPFLSKLILNNKFILKFFETSPFYKGKLIAD